MSEPTAGPWHVYGAATHLRIEDRYSRIVCRVDSFRGDAVDSANASLIAAAPDLLACVRGALVYVEEDEFGNPVNEAYCSPGYAAHLRALKAAIAKAEGR